MNEDELGMNWNTTTTLIAGLFQRCSVTWCLESNQERVWCIVNATEEFDITVTLSLHWSNFDNTRLIIYGVIASFFYFQIGKLPPTTQPQASDYLLKKTKSNNHNHTISKCVIITSSLFPLCNWRILQSTRVVVSLRVRSVCFWSPNSVRSGFCCFYLFFFFLILTCLFYSF